MYLAQMSLLRTQLQWLMSFPCHPLDRQLQCIVQWNPRNGHLVNTPTLYYGHFFLA